jgi:hypothetical protein
MLVCSPKISVSLGPCRFASSKLITIVAYRPCLPKKRNRIMAKLKSTAIVVNHKSS